MPTLLIRLVGELQSWDTQSHLEERGTGREPSKSGVVGLLGAAKGIRRNDITSIAQLAKLKMGVRVDQEGYLLRDYHTAGIDGYMGVDGKVKSKNPIVSTRYYLADAAFLVGLESDDRALLESLQAALRRPKWLLILGRKACPPSKPVYLPNGLKDDDLETALKHYPWLGLEHLEWKARRREDPAAWVQDRYQKIQDKNPRGLRLVLEAPGVGESVRNDQPLSFEKGNRRFAPRRVTTTFVEWPPYLIPDTVSPEN